MVSRLCRVGVISPIVWRSAQGAKPIQLYVVKFEVEVTLFRLVEEAANSFHQRTRTDVWFDGSTEQTAVRAGLMSRTYEFRGGVSKEHFQAIIKLVVTETQPLLIPNY